MTGRDGATYVYLLIGLESTRGYW